MVPRSQPLRQKDLVYVGGVKFDPGPAGPAIARLWKRHNHGLSLDDVATQPSVFDDDKLAPLHQPIPSTRTPIDLAWRALENPSLQEGLVDRR
ncbi:hypothetical protein Q7P36_009008 [Cladosporium allicinum]